MDEIRCGDTQRWYGSCNVSDAYKRIKIVPACFRPNSADIIMDKTSKPIEIGFSSDRIASHISSAQLLAPLTKRTTMKISLGDSPETSIVACMHTCDRDELVKLAMHYIVRAVISSHYISYQASLARFCPKSPGMSEYPATCSGMQPWLMTF